MSLTDDTLRRLLDVGRSLVSELDPETVLNRILEEGREITGARYAALGVLNEQRTELERFITVGIDDETQPAIGEPPRGRGVLGRADREPGARSASTTSARTRRATASLPGTRRCTSFLGVPILIRGAGMGQPLPDRQDRRRRVHRRTTRKRR